MQYVVQMEEVDISDGCEAVNVWDLDFLIVRNPCQEQENWQKVSSGRSRNMPCHSFLRFQTRQTQFLSVSHNTSLTETLER